MIVKTTQFQAKLLKKLLEFIIQTRIGKWVAGAKAVKTLQAQALTSFKRKTLPMPRKTSQFT